MKQRTLRLVFLAIGLLVLPLVLNITLIIEESQVMAGLDDHEWSLKVESQELHESLKDEEYNVKYEYAQDKRIRHEENITQLLGKQKGVTQGLKEVEKTRTRNSMRILGVAIVTSISITLFFRLLASEGVTTVEG